MDLFGHNILDFASEDDLLGNFPRASECQYMADLDIESLHDCYNEESNDSALGSRDSLGSETSSEVRSCADLDMLQDEDSYLNTTVSFEEVFRASNTENLTNVQSNEDKNALTLLEAHYDKITRSTAELEEGLGLHNSEIWGSTSNIRGESTIVPDVENFESNLSTTGVDSLVEVEESPECKNIFDIFNRIEPEPVKVKTNIPSPKSECDDAGTNFQLFGDHCLGQEQELNEQSDSLAFDDLLKSMFEASEEADQYDDYDELLTSILSSEENIDRFDPEYFDNFSNNDEFDIDSVDPACIKIEESDLVEIKTEAGEDYTDYTALVMRDHDYTLPPTSSLFLTPPHSPGEDSETETCTKLVRKSPNKPRNQIVKFNQSKDLKFVINLPVKKEAKINARSILKKKILQDESKSRSARELVREILEKRSLPKHIEEKREFVKSMKRRMREETIKEQSESRGLKSKYRCLENVEIKSDSKKYRKFQEERELHNSMERQRRIEMKEAYDTLKGVIPTIASRDKVSKLNILNTAKDFCHGLEGKLERLEAIRLREEDRQRRLVEQRDRLRLQVL